MARDRETYPILGRARPLVSACPEAGAWGPSGAASGAARAPVTRAGTLWWSTSSTVTVPGSARRRAGRRCHAGLGSARRQWSVAVNRRAVDRRRWNSTALTVLMDDTVVPAGHA